MSESAILARVRVALSAAGAVMFRNNSGRLKTQDGRAVTFGVGPANGGGSDLIGYLSVMVTPEMVGTRVAIFVAAEIKAPRGRATEAQQHFLDTVERAGGIAMLVRGEADALQGLTLPGL